MALIGPSCLAGPTKGEEDLQLEEEEGLRPLASRGKDHREGRMNQKAKKNIYIASWKPQTMWKLHKFESAGPPELLASREKARARKRDWRRRRAEFQAEVNEAVF